MALTTLMRFISFNILGGMLVPTIRANTMCQFSFVLPVTFKRCVRSISERQLKQSFSNFPVFRRHAVSCDLSIPDFDLPTGCTVSSALDSAIRYLECNGIPEAQASAEYLLSTVIRSSRGRLRVDATHVLTDSHRIQFLEYVKKRQCRIPVQYILGGWPFHDLEKDLILRPPTLIPRPETEELVELILQTYCREGRTPGRFLEVGPGDTRCGTSARSRLMLCCSSVLVENSSALSAAACPSIQKRFRGRIGASAPDRFRCHLHRAAAGMARRHRRRRRPRAARRGAHPVPPPALDPFIDEEFRHS
jgi:hypothetical protein